MTQFFIIYPILGYATILAGDVGVDIIKSLKPLIVSVGNTFSSSEPLRDLRRNLKKNIENLVEKLGPEIFPNFEDSRYLIDSGEENLSPFSSYADSPDERESWAKLAETIAF